MTQAARASRLGLGTVQFGLDYGITNPRGRVPTGEAHRILAIAQAAGIGTLDTACLYGDSEAVLGNAPNAGAFRIVSKTPKFADCGSAGEAAAELRTGLTASLTRLGRSRLDALLLHDADDLLGPHGSALWHAMETARSDGLVEKIGVSVYEGPQVDAILGHFPIEIVQLPYNPLDRRLIDGGQIDRLRRANVEIHARSLFLQGLLLQDDARIEAKFGPLRTAAGEMHAWGEERGLSRLETVLALALRVSQIDLFIVGVASAYELQEIVLAEKTVQGVHAPADFATAIPLDARYLNPSRWPGLE